MKAKSYFVLLVCVMSLLTAKAQERMMVIADPHVLPTTLIEADPNFDHYMQSQRKMVDLSEPIWNALMDTALKYKPELLLIPGDLTRDGEQESHELVASSLQKLQEAGISSLVVPGNHDLPNSVKWDSLYRNSSLIVAKDQNSYSYVAEPFSGLTILGIDASHDAESTGSLLEPTRVWLMAQADKAVRKGHIVIAMCHWQILEHVDMQGMMEKSCRIENADAFRDSLMQHGVHLVLTGHFHINGISTYINDEQTDSLTEITTGSPITYPCPYRMLTLSEDRMNVAVETYNITRVGAIDDLHTYSREWMREHAADMLPNLTLRAWKKIDDNMFLVEPYLGSAITALLKSSFPQTDSAKIALAEKYLGSTAVELYLLHSDANEPDYPQADSLAQAFYQGLEDMIREMTDETMNNAFYSVFQEFIVSTAIEVAREPVQSLVEDRTQWRSELLSNRTDDLRGTLCIGPSNRAIEELSAEPAQTRKYIQDGQLLIQSNGKTYNAEGKSL